MAYKIFDQYKATIFEGLFGGKKAAMYESKITVVNFRRLSLKLRLKALELGFSPPCYLWQKPGMDYQKMCRMFREEGAWDFWKLWDVQEVAKLKMPAYLDWWTEDENKE